MSWHSSPMEDFSRPCPRDGYYDVFISFRGIDTRSGFTDTLYRSLLESKIYTFIDADLAGNVIETVFRKIGRSRMAVVVYSERFASSDWCLRELEMIMQQWKEKKMLMIPIFYKVSAHELKHLSKKITKYFDEHIIKYNEAIVGKWKDAVIEIGNVSGFPYKDVYSRSERDFIIMQVIPTIKKKLREWGETGQESNTTKPYNSNSGLATTENHDVFISFLGKDTRYNLINHLKEALINYRKDIKIFIVDQDHQKDDSIFEVIQQSKMTVVVFSPNYASSKWCLRELVKIFQCNTTGQDLLPIFYEIIQPDLINQADKGKIADHLQKHARNETSETVQSWRNAITDLSNLVGWRYSTTHSKMEELANFIQGLVEEILTILDRVEEEKKESTRNQQTRVSSAKEENTQALQTYSSSLCLYGEASSADGGFDASVSVGNCYGEVGVAEVEEDGNEGGVISEMNVDLKMVEKLELSSNDQHQTDEGAIFDEKLEYEEELSFNDQQQTDEDFNVEALEKFVEESSLPVLTLSSFPTEIIGTNKSESTSGQVRMERSKTEKQRRPSILAEDAARIFHEKIPVQQKLKLLNRIATVKDDGTVEFEVPGDIEPQQFGVKEDDICSQTVDDGPLDATDFQYIPPLQIVMLIVGTRGDVQPFVAIGKRLQEYGHRVRLATHSNFKEFVLTAGLEFFPLGGDPRVLAEYMVKNKGFLPSGRSPIQRNQMKEVIYSLLPACKDPDIDSGIPFKADAIIANPPAYGHTHVAEALKIPLHIFSTMPWTPTSEFPHPLSRVKQQSGYRLSYQIVDSFIWLGTRDIINDLRKKKLKLRPLTYLRGSGGFDSDVPQGYIWSPHLVPKPKDWGHKVDVVGFCFLDLASNYEPPEDLIKWLVAGEKPIYIGFGCMPIQEPKKMTQIIVEALEKTGQRGIINKGWGGLGELAEPKDSIYLLDNVPHDWLFLQCKAVVHHGGAGTTAAGLKAACPTTIVPFFGDQHFWGEHVHARGVGPPPIPVDEFSLPKLVHSINYMLDPVVKEVAVELAKAMEKGDGVMGAVKAFFKQLPCRKPEPEPETERPTSSFFSSIGRSFGIS